MIGTVGATASLPVRPALPTTSGTMNTMAWSRQTTGSRSSAVRRGSGFPRLHQFYYHKFYKQQPDLNWRNPKVEKAMFNAMRFWLDRGVAGFRLDAIPSLFEDPQLRDERPLGGANAQGDPNLGDAMTNNLPEVHDVIRRMRTMAAAYPGDRVLIGETYLPNTAELDRWYGGVQKELNSNCRWILLLQASLDKLDALYRHPQELRIGESRTACTARSLCFVFDSHDNFSLHPDLATETASTISRSPSNSQLSCSPPALPP